MKWLSVKEVAEMLHHTKLAALVQHDLESRASSLESAPPSVRPWLKTVDYSLWVGSELLPQVKESSILGCCPRVRVEREMDRLIGAVSAVMKMPGSALAMGGKEFRHSERARSTVAALSCQKDPVEVVHHLIRILLDAFLWRFSGHTQLVGDPGLDPEHPGEILCLIWFGNASGSPRGSWEMLEEGCLDHHGP